MVSSNGVAHTIAIAALFLVVTLVALLSYSCCRFLILGILLSVCVRVDTTAPADAAAPIRMMGTQLALNEVPAPDKAHVFFVCTDHIPILGPDCYFLYVLSLFVIILCNLTSLPQRL